MMQDILKQIRSAITPIDLENARLAMIEFKKNSINKKEDYMINEAWKTQSRKLVNIKKKI